MEEAWDRLLLAVSSWAWGGFLAGVSQQQPSDMREERHLKEKGQSVLSWPAPSQLAADNRSLPFPWTQPMGFAHQQTAILCIRL